MLKAVLAHFARFLSHNPDPDSYGAENAFEKLRLSLGIIIIFFSKLDSSLNLYELLWEALYMFMAVSRFTGDPRKVCRVLAGYLQNKKKGSERFVDPEWRKMSADFKRCDLDTVLDGISANMYLTESVVVWEGREMNWRRTEIGFKLMEHPRPDHPGSAIIEANPIAEDSPHQPMYVSSCQLWLQH